MIEMLWNLLHLNSFLWASCTITFIGVTLNVIQLNWLLVINQMGWLTMRGVEFGFERCYLCLSLSDLNLNVCVQVSL